MRRVRRVALAGASIVLIEVLFLQQYLLAILGCLVLLPIAYSRRRSDDSRTIVAWRISIPLIAIALSILGNVANNRMAENHARVIIEAVERYEKEHGAYPADLNELVPRYLASIPRAKYAVAFSDFLYFSSKHGTTLMWTVVPPFYRRHYDFEARKWGALD